MEESFGFAAYVLEKLPVPVVVKLHGPAFLSLVGTDARGQDVERRIADEGRAIAAATAVTSPARSTLVETLARYRLKPEIAEHINNPLEIRAICRLVARALRPATLLFVGRFDERKGGDLVIEAFASCLEPAPTCGFFSLCPDVGIHRPNGARLHIAEYLDRFQPSLRSRIAYLAACPRSGSRGPHDPPSRRSSSPVGKISRTPR
jgi:glycosyltransferase involved in cell wall biosynthesis